MLHINAPDEHTILLVRKHWFILFAESIGMIVLYAAPFLVLKVIAMGIVPGLRPEQFALPPAIAEILTALWSLFVWTRLFNVWTNYYLDLWLITDKRIVAVDQIRFFNRQMSIFRMERIQDVVVSARGIVPTLLDFGDLHVETAGQGERFIIKGIPHPQKVKDIIMRELDTSIEHRGQSAGV